MCRERAAGYSYSDYFDVKGDSKIKRRPMTDELAPANKPYALIVILYKNLHDELLLSLTDRLQQMDWFPSMGVIEPFFQKRFLL